MMNGSCASSLITDQTKKRKLNDEVVDVPQHVQRQFDSITMEYFFSSVLEIKSDHETYIERLPSNIIQYASYLYLNSIDPSNRIDVTLTSIQQNLDLQVPTRRLGAEEQKHYSQFHYVIPFGREIKIQWRQFTISIFIQLPQKDQSKNSSCSLEGEESALVQIKTLMGAPTTQFKLSFSPRIVQRDFEQFCHECTEFCFQKNRHGEKHIKIYMGSEESMSWDLIATRVKRPWSSVVLPTSIKEDFIQDIETFLKNREFYEANGLRYKRTFLFAGPPGVGKTSLIEAAAAYLNLSLCYLNMDSTINNATLSRLTAELKKDSMVVIEDIDSSGIGQEDRTQNESGVTYSHILNLLDGALYSDGMILVMTCNDRNKLAEAFTRSSRIDRMYKFGYMKEAEIKTLYHQLLPEALHAQWPTFIDKIQHKPNLTPGLLQEFFVSIRLRHPTGEGIKTSQMVSKLNALIKSMEKNKSESQVMMSC